MKYVTEEKLRNWFKEMKDKYSDNMEYEAYYFVEASMFGKFWEDDKLTFEEDETEEKELKEQLTDSTSQVYQMLKVLSDREVRLQKEANRCSNLNALLVSAIQSDHITKPEEVACAISWLDRSDLSSWDIMKKFIFK